MKYILGTLLSRLKDNELIIQISGSIAHIRLLLFGFALIIRADDGNLGLGIEGFRAKDTFLEADGFKIKLTYLTILLAIRSHDHKRCCGSISRSRL